MALDATTHGRDAGDAATGAASRSVRDPRPLSLWTLCGRAMVMGIVTGIGAVFFRALIGLIHNLLFLGTLSIPYDASVFTAPGPWGILVVLVPVIGSLGVTFIVNTFAPEAKGHGVPEVMDAIYYGRGVIRPASRRPSRSRPRSRSAAAPPWGAKGRSSRSARRWVRRSAS